MKEVKLVIVDEISMCPTHALNVMDQVLRRIRGAVEFDDPAFGGMTMSLGGDFRQLPPVPGENETVKNVSPIFSGYVENAEKLPLTKNMRTDVSELALSHTLKDVGEGRQQQHPELPPNSFMVPKEWVIESGDLNDLLKWVFEGQYSERGATCAVLTHTNLNCRKINHQVSCATPLRVLTTDLTLFQQILDHMPGDGIVLYSEDSVVDDDPENPLMDVEGAAAQNKTLITPEELHAETPTGMPYHEVYLKVGAIVMLVRNLDVSSGLVNGLRLRVIDYSRQLVRAEAISGGTNIKGRVIDIARIDFEGDLEATIRMRRTQFPLRLAFAITINKSQGLTLEKVSALSSTCIRSTASLLLGWSLPATVPLRARETVRCAVPCPSSC